MTKRLFNYQQEPRPFGMKTRRLNAVTRILLAIFAMMLIPQVTRAQVDYYEYNTTSGVFDKKTLPADEIKSLPTPVTNVATVDKQKIEAGTYVVYSGNPVSYTQSHIYIEGTVNIILCDGAALTAKYGIEVGSGAVLNIYGQEQGTGVLNATGTTVGTTYYAAVGSSLSYMNSRVLNRAPNDPPQINIHGGQITANSSQTDYCAGIGGANGSFSGSVTIYGGKVTATGGLYSAGIGGGGIASNGCTVSIYGGEVIATGGEGYTDAQTKTNYGAAMGIGAGCPSKGGVKGDNKTLEIIKNIACYGDVVRPNGSLVANLLNGPDSNVGSRYRYMRTVRSYDLWVGTTLVEADNASSILKSAGAAPEASFYPTSNTLKLEKLNADITIQTGIDDFTVLFDDANTLGSSNTGGCIQYTGTGNGELTLIALPLANGAPSTLTITNPGDAPIKGFSTINFNETYIESALPIYFDATDKRYEDKTDVVVSTLKITTDPKYLLWIGGNDSEIIQVTAGSLDINSTIAIQGGSVEYLELLNTFQLVDATINGNIESAMGDLIIEILGSNTINHSTSAASPIVSYNGGDLIMASDGGTGILELAGAGQTYTTDPISGFSKIDYLSDLTLGKNENDNYVVRKPTPYDLKVNGTQVDNNNSWNVLGTPTGTPTVVFETDGTNNTLTLNGLQADFSNPIESELDNLKIVFKGANSLSKINGTKGYIITNKNTATLTFEGVIPATATSTGPSTLYLNNSVGVPAVQGFADVVYNNAYLTRNNACGYNTSLDDNNTPILKMTDVKGGTVQLVTITTEKYYPLWVNSTQVKYGEEGDILSDQKVSFEPSSNTLTLDGESFSNSNAIESFLDNLKIRLKGNNSVATWTYGYPAICSGVKTASLTIEKDPTETGVASLFLKTDCLTPIPSTIKGFNSIDYSGFTPFSVDDSGNLVSDISSTLSYSDNALKLSGNELSSVYFTTVADYGFAVEGTQVTSSNAGDIKGDSKVVYDLSSNTLTLKDKASLTIGTHPAISLGSNLTSLRIELEGSAEILHDGNSTNDAIVGSANAATPTVTIGIPTKSPSSGTPILTIKTKGDFFKNVNVLYDNSLLNWAQNTTGDNKCVIRHSPWGGSGTPTEPYRITSTTDLVALSTFVNSGYIINQNFELATDNLDFGTVTFTSIGKKVDDNQTYSFDGVFEGGGKTIKNLTSQYGLFAKVGFNNNSTTNFAKITGLKLSNCTVTGAGTSTDTDCVGGIVGEMFNSSQIDKCDVTGGSITGGAAIGFVGGIVGALEGTVSGCKVTASTNGSNMMISNLTSNNQTLYTGAIVGKLKTGAVLNNNTYDAGVIVVENSKTKSGNNQRGTGIDDGNGNYDVFNDNGAVLSGLQTIDVTVGANGTVEYLEGCYRYDQQNKKLYALPYSISTQKTKIKATSSLGYDQPTISLTLNGGSYNLANTTAGTDNTGAANATWEFEMPEDDLTATIAFPLDFSSTTRTFAISNPADAKKVYDGNQISITQIKTTFNNNELTLNAGTDFKITQYKDKNNANSTSTSAPTEAGSYEATIEPGTTTGITGSATVDFKIEQADGTVSVSNLTQEVTYDGNSHALSGVSATGGTAVVTYYEKEADRTSGTGGTTQAPTKANVYYVRVTQGNANYASQDVLVTFTINPADIKNAVITAIAEDAWTYDGTAKKPTPEVKFNNKKLTEGDDFTYSWSNNTNAAKSTDNNAPEVIITGKGNFTKTNSLKFTINKATMTGIQASGYTGAYDGAKHGITVTAPAGATVKYGTNVGSYTDTKSPEYKDYSANPYTVYYEVSQANYNTVTGSQDVVINKRSLSGATIGTIAKQTYNKAPHTPEPDVSLVLTAGGQPTKLEKGTDYKFSYENNTDAGRATIKATGQGNFMGDASWNFDIDKADATITFAPDIVYEATYLDQDFTKTVSNTGDGVVKYSSGDENVATVNQTTGQVSIVGSAPNGILMTATVQDGKNYQYATKTATYTLIVKEATLTGVQATGYTGDYDGAGHGITVTAPAGATVKYGTNANSCTDTRSPEYKDYSANPYKVYYEVSQANFATVKGSQTVTINKRSLSGASISQVANETYNGNPYTPEPDVTLVLVAGNQATKLEKGTDYTLAYENNTNAGTATVKVIGTKNFKDEESVNFTISKADISTAVIDAIAAQTYTGSAITPTPAVTWGGKTLKAGTNFTYGYANNKDAADKNDSNAPTVTINGTGNYMGSASTTFTILDRVASIDLGGRTFRTYYNASETNRVPDDIQAYIVTGVNGNEVTVQPVSYIPKQTPVLLEAKAGAKSVKNKADDFTTNKLAYATNDVAANGNQYLLYNGEFVRASGTISGKVYLDLGSSSPARSYTINTNNTTAIEGVFDEETDGEEKWYDMQGRQINKPTKAGLYIRNGQKVVIKNK